MTSNPNQGGDEFSALPVSVQLCRDPIEAICTGWNFLETNDVAHRTSEDLDYPNITSAIEQGLGFGVGLGLAVVQSECHIEDIVPHFAIPRYVDEVIPPKEGLGTRVYIEVSTGNEGFWRTFGDDLRGAILADALPRMSFSSAAEVKICMATIAIGYSMVEHAYNNWDVYNRVIPPESGQLPKTTGFANGSLSDVSPETFADQVIADMWREIDK